MFRVHSRMARNCVGLMTSRELFNITGRAIIPLLLFSWILLVQAIPTSRPSSFGQKFTYDLDASETPILLPGQSAVFECAEQMLPDTVVHWLKDGVSIGSSPTSETKKRRKSVQQKRGQSRNSRQSHSRHLRSVKTSTMPDTQTHDAKSTSPISRFANLTDSNFTVSSNGSLRVLHVKQTHVGEYKCFIQDTSGRLLRRKFNLVLADLPQCAIQPSTLGAHVHNAARLFCSTNIPDAIDVTYTWTKDGKPLPNDHKRFEHVPNGALHFYDVTFDDAGSYRCHVKSALGVHTSEAAQVTVLPQIQPHKNELKFIVAPQNVTVFPPRHRAVFECLVNDPNRTYSWTKRNGEICNYGYHCPIGISYGNNLVLNDVPVKGIPRYSSNDFYTCVIRPLNSRKGIRKTAYLNVVEKPAVSLFATETKILLSKSARLSCTAQGNPPPKMYWMKNGDILPNGDKRSGNPEVELLAGRLYLRINSMESSDAGYYQCIAENIAGSSSSGIRLDAIQKVFVPPPIDVAAMVISESEIFVQWHPPPNYDDAEGFKIAYEPGGVSYPRPKTATNFSLVNLHPYTDYAIKVFTYSHKGPSDPAIVHAKTKETAPCEKVQDPAPYIVNSTAVLLMWHSLSKPDQCGIVTNYEVVCSLMSLRHELVDSEHYSESVFEVTAKQRPDETEAVMEFALITGLEPEGQYAFSVTAATRVGKGEESDFVSAEVPATQEPSCLENGESAFLATNVYFHQDLKHLIVVWRVKQNHSFTVSIDLTLPDSNHIVTSQRLSSSNVSAVFDSVDSRKPYIVTISLLPVGNTSSCEQRRLAVMYEGENDHDKNLPTNISGATAGKGCAKLEWDFQEPFGLDVYYVVRYCVYKYSAGRMNYRYQNSMTKSITVCGLLPWSPYEFAVAAVYSFENLSDTTAFARLPKLIRTLEEEPGVPVDLLCICENSGAVECTWKEPANANGEILHYVLAYQRYGKELWGNVTSAETSTTVNCLKPGAHYIFKVYAVNIDGAGEVSATDNIVINEYDVSKLNCSFPDESPVEPETHKVEAILIGIGIGIFCVILCVLMICFCLPGRQAKFALYRGRKKKRLAKKIRTNKTEGGPQQVNLLPSRQNGHCVHNGYHVPNTEGLDEQHVNLLPKNGVAASMSNGSVPKNGFKKHHIVQKNGFHKENSLCRSQNGVTKQNGIRKENGTAGSSFRSDTLSRQKLEKRTTQPVPESNSSLNHSQRSILSVPIPKHCSSILNNETSLCNSDGAYRSHTSNRKVSFSDVD